MLYKRKLLIFNDDLILRGTYRVGIYIAELYSTMENEFEQNFKPSFKIRKIDVDLWRLAIYEFYYRKKNKDVKIILWDEIKEEDIKNYKKS